MNHIRYFLLLMIAFTSCRKDKPIDKNATITENFPPGWEAFKTGYDVSFTGLTLNHSDDIWCYAFHPHLYKMTGAVLTDHSGAINQFLGYNSRISSLAVDKNDQVWIAINNLDSDTTLAGLIRYDGANCQTYNLLNSGIHNNKVMNIVIDSKDQKWLGTSNSLVKYDGKTWSYYDSLNAPLTEYYPIISAFGSVWITGHHSLKKFDGTSFINWDVSNSSFPASGMRITDADGLGNLWFMDYTDTMNLWKFNGTSFSSFAIPAQYKPTVNSLFTTLKVDLSNNIWVVGAGRLLKFNGSTWKNYEVPYFYINGGDPRYPPPKGPIPASFLDMVIKSDSSKWFIEKNFSGKNIMSFRE